MCSAHCVSINSKDVLVERRIDANDVAHLVVNFQLQRGHRSIEVNAVQVVHQQNLTVTFSAITRLGPFCRLSDLDYDHIPIGAVSLKRMRDLRVHSRDDVSLELVETGIHLSVIDCTGTFPDGLEKQRLWVEFGIHAKDIEDDPGRWLFVPAADDHAVADDEQKLPLVVVVESGEGVDCATQGIFAFRITRNLADDKFIQHLWVSLGRKLQRGKDCRTFEVRGW